MRDPGAERRTERETLRFTPSEHGALVERASLEGRRLADTIRVLALAEARRRAGYANTDAAVEMLLRDRSVDLRRLLARLLRARPELAGDVAEALQESPRRVAQ